MTEAVDLNAEFAKLAVLDGRTPTSTAAERQTAIARLTPYRDGAVFAAKFSGKSAWERHPQGDEIVHIVEGKTTLHLITAEGRESLALKAGMLVVVPQNAWHQFEAPDGVSLMTATPQPTEHLEIDVDDPRTVSKNSR
jgi:mannose-6-phosphate isomerase-like protein (cupin superfamily)